MKRFISKPYGWFLIAITVFYVASLLIAGNNSIDIQLHDTMFVIAYEHIYLFCCLWFFVWALLLVVINGVSVHQPNKIASIVHVGGTVLIPLIVILLVSVLYNNNRYYTYANFESIGINGAANFIAVLMLVFIAEQLLFFLYMLVLLVLTGIDKVRKR